MTQSPKPRRKYYDPAFLLRMYRWMKEYSDRVGAPPSNLEVVAEGYASSTSTARYYYDRMVEYGMIAITPNISRGIKLLPLADADPIIKELVKW
jgi:hypothetical protein